MIQRLVKRNQKTTPKAIAQHAVRTPLPTCVSKPLSPKLQLSSSNHGMLHCCGSAIQTKLKIGSPGDKYEREANRVAEQVMRPKSTLRRQPGKDELVQTKPIIGQITPLVQRQVGEKWEPREEEKEVIQPKTAHGQTSVVTPDVKAQIGALRGKGQPLPQPVRTRFESRFGHDFNQVRIHADSQAAKAAKALNAQAFTVGHNIAFDAGQYAPDTPAGQRLLAHELAHVVQKTESTTVMRQTRVNVKKPLVVGGAKPRSSGKAKRSAGYENIVTPAQALGREEADRINILVWNDARLVKEAKRKDIYLRHYSDDLGPDVQSEIAKTLILMFEEMDKRVKALPFKLGPNGIILPPKGLKWSSENLAGITTAIDPFHMIDWWGPYVKTSASSTRRLKKTPQASPAVQKPKVKKPQLPAQTGKRIARTVQGMQKRERERAERYDKISTVVSIADLAAGIISGIVGGIVSTLVGAAMTVLGVLLSLADNSARQKHYSKIIAIELGLRAVSFMAANKGSKFPSRIRARELESEIKKRPSLRWRWDGQISFGGTVGATNEVSLRQGLGIVVGQLNRAMIETEQKYRAYLRKNVAAKNRQAQYQKNIDHMRRQVVQQVVLGALPKVASTLRKAQKKMQESK